jgi:hypothetical protein
MVLVLEFFRVICRTHREDSQEFRYYIKSYNIYIFPLSHNVGRFFVFVPQV